MGIQRSRDADQDLSEVGVDAPVAGLVGVGQGGARHPAAEAHVIKLALHGAQASFDVAEALAKGRLGKGQAKELIEAGKAARFVIAAVPRDALVELVPPEPGILVQEIARLALLTGADRVIDTQLELTGLVGEPDGSLVLSGLEIGAVSAGEALGETLAQRLLQLGAGRILERVYANIQ